jgi:hypothetical protein
MNRVISPSTTKNKSSNKFTTSVLEKQGTAKKDISKPARANSSAKQPSVKSNTPKQTQKKVNKALNSTNKK